MTLTVKDSPAESGPGKSSSPSQNRDTASSTSTRSNPVCLEVPIAIRSLPGEADKASESAGFTREEGRTVIVFDNGAVLRIPKQLPPGQMVVLSNQQGREIACRVLGGRNLPNKGYVEIEFTEQVDDFWRIHQTSMPAGPAPKSAVSGTLQTAPLEPHRTAQGSRESGPDEDSDLASGRAPTFEDVAGLVPMSPASVTVQDAREKNRDRRVESNFSALKGKSELATTESETRKVPSVKGAPSISESEKPGISPALAANPAGVQNSAQENVLAGRGVLASPYSASAPTTTESRRPMALIMGGAGLALVSFAAGYFVMHRGSVPKTAPPSAVVSAPPTPAAPVINTASADAASQLPAPQPSNDQAATTAIQPVSTPAPAPTEAELDASDSQSGRVQTKTSEARQAERAAPRRPTISNLKMKSPATPKASQVKLADGSSLSAADLTSSVATGGAAGGALLSSVMRPENLPAPPSGISTPVVSRTVREPQLVTSTHFAYPLLAKQSKVQGKVVVIATVDAKGNVTDVKAVSGPPLLREAAMETVKQWKYSPALVDGRPNAAQVTVSLDFRLN